MLRKKILSIVSAAAMAATVAVGDSVSAKDMGINGTYTQGKTLETFFRSDCLGYESIELNYEYVSAVETPAETFGILAFDSEWGGWNKTSIGQDNPALNVEYTDTVELSDIESSLTTGKDFYGFNLITDNFGTGSVKVNSVILNDKQGQETTIAGSWHKGTASAMTSTDSDMVVDANEYNIYLNGFSAYGFTNPTIDVTVTYDSDLGTNPFKEATLYYAENYQQENETFTPVEQYGYKEAEAGSTVTYSYSISGEAHQIAACFDACTVTEIKIYDKTPEATVIKGNWTKGTASELTLESGNPDFWFSGGEDSIYVFNFSLEGYRSPTVEVTANYSSIPADGSYMQAELYSGSAKIGGSFIPVTETGPRTFTFDVSKDLTEFNVCFDGCTVTEVKIYDNRSPIPAQVSGKTADELAGMMGKAWNLGNALDSTSDGTVGETLWNNKFPVSKEMFDAVKAAGFDTVRIPVSYMDKIVENADGTYTIDSAYMARVKQVVDAAISANLFVIVNIHNDGGNGVEDMWLDITKTGDEFTAVQNKFAGVWSSIANTFADYDQKLIFEGFNELNNGNYNSTPSTSEIANVNSLNQAFVTAVRNSGGENKKNQDRILILNGYNADIDNTVNGFAKPDDKTASNVIIENRLMLSVHYYDPYDFALNENGTSEWDADTEYMEGQLQKIVTFANGLNMPVVIGEYGAIDKNNIDSREEYIVSFNAIATELGIVTAYWDNGNSGQYGFAIFDRTNNNVTTAGQVLLSSIIG
ncbi:glycoside hydrolase family 5 protein [Ruminococcus sp. Marseille-P6503]|uniref:glycoside hydrolase family 5 protein n=1 Tax=Ruminococcus sp. Marseille-P6503 TaxID=2364796 RepID=UPI000F51D277|nr:glycoside hydrolase family 5 protein [Ruminococcus sp. Marseille-P6503]